MIADTRCLMKMPMPQYKSDEFSIQCEGINSNTFISYKFICSFNYDASLASFPVLSKERFIMAYIELQLHVGSSMKATEAPRWQSS
jgi:hypothetical protein